MATIYHNPRCSKSRETLALLTERVNQVDVVEYLKTPLNAQDISTLLAKLGCEARDLLRTKEEEYQQLGLGNNDLTEQHLINAMVEHPKLIERPIVVIGEKAVIGRPPENILTILS